jgi:uncharacterized protein (DUF427 family)
LEVTIDFGKKNMTRKPMKIPGPDHPITIERNFSRVVVTVGGRIVADTCEALTLREAKYPPVQYIPRKERSDHTTYCPYKGDCAYYSIPAGGTRSINAMWTYDPDRVDVIEEISVIVLA